MPIDWEPLGQIIEENQRFVLSSHVRPDADALGSELAMANLLQAIGKDVVIANASAAPATLLFLDPDERVRRLGSQIKPEDVLDTDVHMILDTSAWTQLSGIGDLLKKTEATRVVIDHHVSSDNLNAIEFKDTKAEATGTLIYQLAKSMGWEISKQTGEYIFCAIATDTGWFRFPSTNSDTLRIIGDLMDCDVEPHILYQKLYEQKTLARLHLAGRILGRVAVDCDGLLAYTTVELKDFKATGASPVDTEDLVNECLRISGVKAAFIAVEQMNKQIKLSLRSRIGTDVSAIAEKFGGGGHRQASGATMPGPLHIAKKKVLEQFTKALVD